MAVWRHACSIHCAVEGLDGEASDIPLREPGGGPAVCVWEGGQGTTADLHADVHERVAAALFRLGSADWRTVAAPLVATGALTDLRR